LPREFAEGFFQLIGADRARHAKGFVVIFVLNGHSCCLFFTATFSEEMWPSGGFCQNFAAGALLPDFRIIDTEVAGAGEVALAGQIFSRI